MTPAEGGEMKPVVKRKGQSNNQHGGRNNANRRKNYIKKEKFLRADPNLCKHVFKAKRNQSEHVSNFTIVDNIVKAQVGTECDPFVLKSLEKEVKTGPDEPVPVTKNDGSMTKIEEIKFKSKYNKYLDWFHKVEMQLKQTHSKYYRQIDEEMKG